MWTLSTMFTYYTYINYSRTTHSLGWSVPGALSGLSVHGQIWSLRYKVSHLDSLYAINFGSTLSSITLFGVLHLPLLTDLEHKVFFHNFNVETPD